MCVCVCVCVYWLLLLRKLYSIFELLLIMIEKKIPGGEKKEKERENYCGKNIIIK